MLAPLDSLAHPIQAPYDLARFGMSGFAAQVSIEESQPLSAREKSPDAAVEMNEVEHSER
jgi:hypothetical protein